MIAKTHEQRHESGRAHAPGDVFQGNGGNHDGVALAASRQPHETEVGNTLQYAEHHQGAKQAEAGHEAAPEQHTDDGGDQAHALVDGAHLGGRKTWATKEKGCGQGTGKGVPQFVQHNQQQQQQRTPAGKKFPEGLQYRIIQ